MNPPDETWAARMRHLVSILPPVPAKAFGAAIPLALTSNFRQRIEPWHRDKQHEQMLFWCLKEVPEDTYSFIRASLYLFASGQRKHAWRALREMEALLLDIKTA